MSLLSWVFELHTCWMRVQNFQENQGVKKKELPDLLEIFGSFLVPSSNISNYFIMMKARKGQNYLSEISSNRRNSGNSVLHPSGQQDLMSNQYRSGQWLSPVSVRKSELLHPHQPLLQLLLGMA